MTKPHDSTAARERDAPAVPSFDHKPESGKEPPHEPGDH
jgi:hypothetical protein